MTKKQTFYAVYICLLLIAPLFASAQKNEKTEFESYLFAFFSDNSPYGEQIRYALSDDGFNYRALNDGQPVISSDSCVPKMGRPSIWYLPTCVQAKDGRATTVSY